ncbi:MAG: PepSY domain-containing protein [Paracoccaceae bacterium]
MKKLALALLFAGFAMPALADDEATPEQVAAIDKALEAMTCEVAADNIEVEDGIFDLDDVQCADGQYDIKLNADYTVKEKRKE